MKRWFRLVLGIVVCGWGLSAVAQDKVRMGYIPIATVAGFLIALDKGFFKEANIAPEPVVVPGGPAILAAIAGGSLQFGYGSYVGMMQAREQGLDFVIVAANDAENPKPSISGVLVLNDSDIKSAKDLEGKHLAVNALRNINWVYIYAWMAKHGADPKKVSIIEVGFPNMGSALRAKRVQAAFLSEPFMTAEMDAGGVRALSYPFAEFDPGMPIAGWYASDKWAKANPDLVRRFAAAIKKGNEYATKNPAERNAILAKYTKIDAKMIERIVMPNFPTKLDVPGLQRQADTAHQYGALTQRLDVAPLVLDSAK